MKSARARAGALLRSDWSIKTRLRPENKRKLRGPIGARDPPFCTVRQKVVHLNYYSSSAHTLSSKPAGPLQKTLQRN